jgi:cytochrome c oxidase accessory protein FixG
MANGLLQAEKRASGGTGAPQRTWHRMRKFVHLFCFLAFVALPFFDVVRFDIPRQRFYFVGYELWIHEFGIIFFALMFLMFLVVMSSVFYGRVYCGYLCPQMIFSETSMALEAWLRRRVTKRFIRWKPQWRERVARGLFFAVVAVGSVFLAFVFISYFVEPRDLLRRLASFDLVTAGGIAGAAVTLVTFLDFSLLRLRFCTTACPYGYLQGMLSDSNTLLVHYRDETHECIECKKCVRVCPMGIDIRKSPFQIECVHCADCIDACDEILGKLGKPGLIHYVWGEKGPLSAGRRQPWDAKRAIVTLLLLCYASGLGIALAKRRLVVVDVSPLRATLYRVGADGRVYNRFRYSISNRGKKPAAVIFSIVQLPGASLDLEPNPVPVAAGLTAQGEFEIWEPAGERRELVSHFTIVTGTAPDRTTNSIPMTFLAPVEGK